MGAGVLVILFIGSRSKASRDILEFGNVWNCGSMVGFGNIGLTSSDVMGCIIFHSIERVDQLIKRFRSTELPVGIATCAAQLIVNFCYNYVLNGAWATQ